MRLTWMLCVAASMVCLACPALAVPYPAPNGELIEIEYWAGSGANEAFVLVDFNQGPSDVYTFGYRWDGAADGGDALTAITAAGGLDAVTTNWGGPPPAEDLFLDSLTYNGVTLENNVNFPWSPSWYLFFDDSVGPGELIGWTMADLFGMSGHTLTNGAFEGWLFSYDVWPNYVSVPRQPLGPAEEVIPEPCTLALLAAGACAVAARRRRRTEARGR